MDELQEGLLANLLRTTREAPPDHLPQVVTTAVERMGGKDAVLYLVDHEQALLVPLQGEGIPERKALEIDATLAGRTYRTLEVLEGQGEGGQRLWAPLLDGTQRVGVLELTLPEIDDQARQRCWSLASLLGELIVAKGAFTDVFALHSRQREVTLPTEIQWSLLPPLTLVTPRITICAILEPAYEIAGDSFDYAVNGNTAHLAVFDAMGHGLESSLLSVVAVGSYRNSRRCGLDLKDTFFAMDSVIARQFGTERFVTAWIAELDLDDGYLRWINAGHPPPLLIRDTRVVADLAAQPVLPIGMGESDVVISERQLEPGDRVLAYTDGVIEARAPDGEFFGTGRLADFVVREAAARQRVPEMLRRLGHAILAHQEGRLNDDATILFCEWAGL